jgi:GNAT superfamily N-acetyltransferase
MRILTNLSAENLALAVENNHVEWVRIQGRLPWVQLHDEGDALWLFAGDTWPRNTVVRSRFTPDSVHRRVGEILAEHLQKKVACNWVIGPASRPSSLPQSLRFHGFSCRIHCAGMACDLTTKREQPQLSAPVEIHQVDEAPSLQPLTTSRRRDLHRGLSLASTFQPRTVWHFAAFLKGKTVGATTLQTGAGVAGIYGVQVLEKHRRKGIATALVYAALNHASSLGFRAAVLSATGKGHGVYERLGFHEVCKLSFWKYGKMRQLD